MKNTHANVHIAFELGKEYAKKIDIFKQFSVKNVYPPPF